MEGEQESRCSPTREGVYQGVCRVRGNEEFAPRARQRYRRKQAYLSLVQ